MIGDYIPDRYDINFLQYELKHKKLDDIIEETLKELDCSRYIENIGYPLTYNCTAYYKKCWFFNAIMEHGINYGILSCEQCENYRTRFNDIDEQNAQFAKENPEIGKYKKNKNNKKKEYNTDANESKRRTRKVSTKDIFSGKVSTETLSEDGTLKKTAADRRKEVINNKAVKFAFTNFKK